MTYAQLLEERFPDLDPCVDDLLLLEAHQIAGLPDRAPARELAAVLHAHPRVRRFFVIREPAIEPFLDTVLAEHDRVDGDELSTCEHSLLWELADLIVYQRDPARYDATDDVGEGLAAITDVVALDDKVVVDAGAGTGRVTLAAARSARHVFAVEPVAALRHYLRERADRLGFDNVYVVDGFLHAIPLPGSTADALLTRQAIGWHLDDELTEIERVVAPGGAAVHLTGMPYPAPADEPFHDALVGAGYSADSYVEREEVKRRYWNRR